MNINSSQEGLTLQFASNRAKALRLVVISQLLLLLYLVPYMILMGVQEIKIPFIYLLLISAVAICMSIAGAILQSAVEITLTTDVLLIKRGFGLLTRKPKRIELKNIHTIRFTHAKGYRGLPPKMMMMAIIYRWPERKMVYVVEQISISAIPDKAR